MAESNIFYGQDWLIDRAKQIGPINKEGICTGVANMGMQAILARYLRTFDQRLINIESIEINHFKQTIDALKQRRIEIIEKTKGYDLSLMSIISFDKLDTSKLDNKPYLIKDDQDKYQIWGYKENKWQLTDIGNLEIGFEWKQDQTVFISPKDRIFNTLKEGHTQTKEKINALDKTTIEQEINKLANEADIQKMLVQLQQTINELIKEGILKEEEQEKEFSRRKEMMLFNAFLQKEITREIAKLNYNEQCLLDVPVFF